tara:strand:+ start:210 stop:1568 length:1359 start_codon:yes stop_codon:yes gene_type:complete
MDKKYTEEFMHHAAAWIFEGYCLDIRYMGRVENGIRLLSSAVIDIVPFPVNRKLAFAVNTESFFAGHMQIDFPTVNHLFDVLNTAVQGGIHLDQQVVHLDNVDDRYSFYSNIIQKDAWFINLHLRISGNSVNNIGPLESVSIDNSLRAGTPPFDGLQDISHWLNLRSPLALALSPSIDINITPPVNIFFDECFLKDDDLRVILHAHSNFSIDKVKLAVLVYPRESLDERIHFADRVLWQEGEKGLRHGKLDAKLHKADSVLLILMIDNFTVRRQWLVDPGKARNSRYLAVNCFDREITKIHKAILQENHADKFEKAVSSLFFMLGFSPTLQIESDSPDIIVGSPLGKILIIECTIKIADFSQKMGKLVDRKVTLEKYFKERGHYCDLIAILVCKMPLDQIALNDSNFKNQNVILITEEDLSELLMMARYTQNPDLLIDDYLQRISTGSSSFI